MVEGNMVINVVCLAAVVLLLLGSVTWMAPQDVDVPTAEDIAENVNIPEIPVINLTSVEDRLGSIETTLDEDDDWKDEAIALATDNWEERDYKEIYKAIDELFEDIDDRNDIESVVIKDEEVTSSDADDEDAVVVQELKVKYEDLDGETVKVYLTVITEIEEGEVEDQDIEETNNPIIVVS